MRLFIVNPVSGNRRGKEVWLFLQQYLIMNRISYSVEFTEKPGHAREIALNAINRSDLQAIIVVGGDGTLHEVGNALVHTNIPVGYIPAGSANDFALAQKISFDPEQALERILNHQIRKVDTADFGGRTMISFMGVGFDGAVAEAVNGSSWKRWLRSSAYTWGVLKLLKSYRPTQISLNIDGESFHYDDVWFIAITNIPNYAGGMKICPHAADDDGQLDICCVRDMSRSQLLRVFPSVYKGEHIDHPSITLHRGSEITIDSDTSLTAHADGEIIGKTPLSVSVRPQSLVIL